MIGIRISLRFFIQVTLVLPTISRENTIILSNAGLHNSQAEGPENEYSNMPKKSESNKLKSKVVKGKRKRDERCNKEGNVR